MTHAPLAIACGLLLALSSCSDQATGFATASAAGSRAIVIATTAGGNAMPSGARAYPTQTAMAASAVAESSTTTEVAGFYDIDSGETKRHAGFLGSLIEPRVRGSTLELRTDMTYAGMRNGKPESAGTWRLEHGKLTLMQTHENHEPSSNRGTGDIEDGILTVKTRRHGLMITLVFRHR